MERSIFTGSNGRWLVGCRLEFAFYPESGDYLVTCHGHY